MTSVPVGRRILNTDRGREGHVLLLRLLAAVTLCGDRYRGVHGSSSCRRGPGAEPPSDVIGGGRTEDENRLVGRKACRGRVIGGVTETTGRVIRWWKKISGKKRATPTCVIGSGRKSVVRAKRSITGKRRAGHV